MRDEWPSKLKKGDVILAKSGDLRLVREVRHYLVPQSGLIRSHVTLAIRRCSWTHRPYTVLGDNDLRIRGFRPTGINVAHLLGQKDIDLILERDFHAFKSRDCKLKCCDVRGLP